MSKPEMGEGMKALQKKVADKIYSARDKRRSRYKPACLLLKMRHDFKLAVFDYSRKHDASMTHVILEATAKEIGWEGEI